MFINIEGIDGAGTSTQTAAVAAWLRRHTRRTVCETREPFDPQITSCIRAELASDSPHRVKLLALYVLDRVKHHDQLVTPALARGEIVVSDRGVLSTLIYQAEHFATSTLRDMCRWFREPDLTVVIDVPTDVALERMQRAGKVLDDYERRRDFQETIAQRYRESVPARGVLIDGAHAPQDVTAMICQELVETYGL